MIEMQVPPGGAPPPHRHDFEEMFTLLEGELDFTFRGATRTVRAGTTTDVPANAPPVPSAEQQAATRAKLESLLPRYKTEMVTI